MGQMTNLMSNDVNRFDTLIYSFHYLWVAPLQEIITIFVLYRYVIGVSSLTRMAFLIVFVPLQSSKKYQRNKNYF